MEKVFFKVTKQHLKLARGMYSTWNHMEFGAPSVDPKRPYGNSNVYEDMGNILGISPADNGEFSDEQGELFTRLHIEMETVLQILLRTLSLKAGTYESEKYMRDWKRKP